MFLMLDLKQINAGYGEIQVLWDVSIGVEEGEIVVLLGSNGAGKSTLLKTISGINSVNSGSILLDSEDLCKLTPTEIVKRGIIQVPEARHLFNEMTVEENIIMGSLFGEAKALRSQTLEECYALFPILKERRRQSAGTLSGGEQQMVAVARGLMAKPRILMLDEPSLGLAPILVQDIFNIIKTIHRQGITVLLVEQNVTSTLGFCDRAYVIENGRIVLSGTGEELMKNPKIKEAYLGA
jgi:branched-chain amino acid transport system ATP-binding protein